jgi:hypothetical protein
MIFPLETLPPPGDPNGGVVYLRIVLSPEEASPIYISVFGKRLSRKCNNMVVFLFAFRIAVEKPFKPFKPFKPLWSRLLVLMVHLKKLILLSLHVTVFPKRPNKLCIAGITNVAC